jgi:acyl dehydratase
MTDAIRSLTGVGNYFEDFTVGDVLQHPRGKTMTEMDNVLLTNLVLNTASAHFDEHDMSTSGFGQRITFGGITAALVIGLASQDTSENSLAELGATGMRFLAPVLHGDTVYAFSEVLGLEDRGRPDSGDVVFAHWGVNQNDVVVFEGKRQVRVKKRSWQSG